MGFSFDISLYRRALHRPFAISRGVRTHQTGLALTLTMGGITGRAETSGLTYRGETPEANADYLRTYLQDTDGKVARDTIAQDLLPGGVRAVLDCALWDFEAHRTGVPVWEAAGLKAPPQALETAFTISLDTPAAMRKQAELAASRPLLKVKLGRSDELEKERIRAVRAGAPNARLIADANSGWSMEALQAHAQVLADCGYELVEQPLPIGQEAALMGLRLPLPLCLDESVNDRSDLARFAPLMQVVNIKIEKAGGLTEALAMKARAQALGLKVFVGCMLGGTVSIAPAFILAQGADYVDLDGPLWLAEDAAPLAYTETGSIGPIPGRVWGGCQRA